MSVRRKGKGNPAYKDGLSKTSLYAGKHLRACAKYRSAFMKKHEHAFCEVCGINAMGTPRFEVHHIYYASLWPKHPELHNFRNLIHVCSQCHRNFHGGKKYQEIFAALENGRGLKELFKTK